MEAKISHSGLLARSPEGHAARGMQIKGNEDLWVEIQANTFRNWVNEHLPQEQRVSDLSTDLCTGVRLCILVEALQGRPMRPSYNKRPMNQHQYLENVTAALNAIEKDGVKLVNIGNVDIVNGNLKLILGLIWSLIVRYQIGRSKFPPRKLMLAWLQGVLPECEVHNLTTDWNSGVLLSALVDYCQPGLFSHWRSLDKKNSVENCRRAMSVAQNELGIPAVLEPEYLASPWLDELSGMTYLSYFMKPNSPGFYATLRWVNSRLNKRINNFTTDWNDGKVLAEVVRSLGGNVPPPDTLRTEPSQWEDNLSKGIVAGEKLGVRPILSARDMADKNVEHLGVMAYAAHYQWVPERPPIHDLIKVHLDSTSARVGEPMNYAVKLLDDNLSYNSLKIDIKSPDNRSHQCYHNRGRGEFTPQKIGMHEIVIHYENELIPTSYFFRVLPPLVEVAPPGMAPCALGSLVQVLVNATGAPKKEDILVTAYSPHNRPLKCPLQTIDGTNSATFQPDEAGEWRIEITYQGKHIQGGPFTCQVFDTRGVHVSGFEGALPLLPHVLEVDTTSAGVIGEVYADVVHDKRSVHVRVEKVNDHQYKLHFTPKHNGKHRVYVYFNGYDVKGSPFMMKVGTQRGKKSSNNSPSSTTYRQSPLFNQSSSKLFTNTTSNSPSPSNMYRHSPTSQPNQSYSRNYSSNSPSPVQVETSKLNNYQTKTTSSYQQRQSTDTVDAHRKLSSSSPIERRISPAQSPSYYTGRLGAESPDQQQYYKKTVESTRTYETNTSPNVSKLSSMRINEARSPIFMDYDVKTRTSPYSALYDKDLSEKKHYTSTITRNINVDDDIKVDTRPIVQSFASDRTALRKDSRDAIEKTKNLLSYRSLESVANLAENQLDSNSYGQSNQYVTKTQETRTITNNSSSKLDSKISAGGISSSKLLSSSHMDSFNSGVTGARAVRVQPVPDGFIGQPVEFEIDGSGAGSGDLEILVEGGRVTSSVRSLGGQRFRAAFTPHQALPHRVDIRFNGETVPGSPWNVNIMTSPSLSVMGDSTRLVPANSSAIFEIITSNPNLSSDELTVNVLAPSKRIVPARVLPGINSGVHSVEFLPTEVGTHIVEVAIGGEKLAAGPLIAKVYDAELIQVADVSSGIVGQPVQFRVDASQAGEGQLEISINEGEVPNHVQVVGGGRCLVSFTPDQAKPHLIDIKFNGETVRGCPFICNVTDTSRVTLNLSNLELIPVHQANSFHIGVGGGGAAELAVAVRGPLGELPVKVTGDIHSGFTAEFTPLQVGAHQITVDYNGRPVQGTPFIAKAFDASRVTVGSVSRGTVGRPVTFSVDASDAGEGNLEITISARGLNIPTQVHPQGNARFAVSFIPAEACDHIVNVAFNKRAVEGCPLIVGVSSGAGGPSVTLPGPGPVHKPATLLINHSGKLEDIEVNVEGPGGQAVPTQVQSLGNGAGFRAEFVPRVVGEHRVAVSVLGTPAPGSPYAAKVYDVNAIKVKEAVFGVVGKPVTFLVETSQAGPGNLEVTVNGGRVPTSAQAQGPHTYAISFTPREATPHSVDLRFNGQDVPGSPFTCTIAPAARLVGPDTLDKVSVGQTCQFSVESLTAPIVEILGPSRRPLTPKIVPHTDSEGKFNVEFIPIDVGDHSVEVRIPGGHIEGSPFLVKAYDASRVSVTDITDGVVGKPVSFNINASQAGAGNLEIIVAVNGKNVPNFVQSEGNARFKVNFKPTEAATHSLSVRFNGQAVPGSPFACKVMTSNAQHRVPVSGTGLELAALGSPAEIILEGANSLNPKIMVTSPTGSNVRTLVQTQGESVVANFTPTVVGRHSISVFISDQHIVGSPFCCNVYDVTKVVVTGLPNKNMEAISKGMSDLSLSKAVASAEVGKPITFSVDAAQAGEGTLELVVSTKQSTVKAEVVACARGLYDVTFIPQTSEVHFVNITFNDTPVPGSPFECAVIESMQYIHVGSVAKIDLPSENHRAEIVDPNNRKVSSTMHGKTAEFTVSQIGTYRVLIFQDMDLIVTKTIHIFDPSKIEVVSAPEAICHRPAVVGISLRNTGPGVLSASVKVGNKNVPHSVRQNPGNPKLWEVIFHPENAAPHKIMLLYNGVPKQGVLEVPVRAPGTEPWAGGLGLYQSQVAKVTAFTIDTLGKPAREFDVVVSGPNGSALPVRCYQTRTGKLQAEWTANMSGPHRVEVLHQARPLSGSPFTCQAFISDRVKIVDPPSQVLPGDTVIFNVNTKDCGIAELDVSVTNSIGHSLPVRVTPLDEHLYEVSFITATTGVYNVTVSYGGINLPQSPFNVAVGPVPPLPPPRAVGPGLEAAQVGEMTSFTVNSSVQPHIKVEAVEGTINAHIKAVKPGEYIVSYIPLWVGTYDILISCAGQTLAGCPFRPTVVDTNAVRVIGGWQQYLDDNGRLKLPCKIALDVANAGPGQIECMLSERKVNIESNGNRVRLDISAEGLGSGEHDFLLTFGNIRLTDAPQTAVTSGDQVVLTGRGLAQAQCDEISSFNIDGSRAGPGSPEVALNSADSNMPVPVSLIPVADNVWKAQYTIQSPGSYLLSVLWAGRPVRGCPLMIEAKGGADASKVICSGEGLRHGVVGREIRSWIDTRRAGPGELTAHCAGPRKVAYCELYDHGDATFTLNVKPQESGRHALTVKYAGKHVPGSPFLLRVAGAPDASKVRVYGPGIEHGVLATFQSRFICDTRGAGAGQLTVRVRGPKGAFRVEMQRESQKDRTILCKYDPTEPGDYRVEVKWAGELVPGSPFPVMIFDTQEELRRYINAL